MGVGIEQYRMRVGLFQSRLCSSKKKSLHLYDVFCIYLIFFSADKRAAVAIVMYIYMTSALSNIDKSILQFINRKRTDIEYQCCIHENKHIVMVDCVLHITFLVLIVQLLLIIAGIELNPGPEHLSFDESFSDSDTSSIFEMFSTSFSFLHLNVQSLVPKLDIISAEYDEFDILSFTETWLNSNHTDDSIKLENFQKPFRRDRCPQIPGGRGNSLY